VGKLEYYITWNFVTWLRKWHRGYYEPDM